MSPEKPVFLLAHGAWHPSRLYDPLRDAFAKLGYTLVVPSLPTAGPDARDVTWEADVEALLQAAGPLFSRGKEVVLVGHSYGGIPACIATRGNGVSERRARGLAGGFAHVGFLCAFAMPSRGVSQAELMRHQLPPWQDHVVEAGCIKQLVVNREAKGLLYNDLPAEMADEYFSALVPQSWAAMEKPVDFAVPDITIPKTYVICDGDQAFPTAAQHHLSDSFGLRKLSVSGGHTAFASVPDELASVLIGMVGSVE